MGTILRRMPTLLLLCALAAVVVGGAMILIDDDPTVPASARPIASPTVDEASPIPDDDQVVAIRPERARIGDQVELRIKQTPGIYGLHWVVERLEGSSWQFFGNLVAGPGKPWEKEKFYLPPNVEGGADDIGFDEPASIELEIPQLEPGMYRLVQDFVRSGQGSVEKRTQRHAAEFELID